PSPGSGHAFAGRELWPVAGTLCRRKRSLRPGAAGLLRSPSAPGGCRLRDAAHPWPSQELLHSPSEFSKPGLAGSLRKIIVESRTSPDPSPEVLIDRRRTRAGRVLVRGDLDGVVVVVPIRRRRIRAVGLEHDRVHIDERYRRPLGMGADLVG